jgi:hypothetical protein
MTSASGGEPAMDGEFHVKHMRAPQMAAAQCLVEVPDRQPGTTCDSPCLAALPVWPPQVISA